MSPGNTPYTYIHYKHLPGYNDMKKIIRDHACVPHDPYDPHYNKRDGQNKFFLRFIRYTVNCLRAKYAPVSLPAIEIRPITVKYR